MYVRESEEVIKLMCVGGSGYIVVLTRGQAAATVYSSPLVCLSVCHYSCLFVYSESAHLHGCYSITAWKASTHVKASCRIEASKS